MSFDDAFRPTQIDDPEEHVRAAVNINGGDLRRELERLPADLAHYGFEFARAHRRMLAAKMAHDEVRAVAYLRHRENLEMLNAKRPTEAEVDATVLTDQAVRQAKSEQVEAEYERERIRAVVDALRAKRENLTSLVLLARAELAGAHGFREPARVDGRAAAEGTP